MVKTYIKLLFIVLLSGIMCGCIGGTSQKSVYYIFSASQKLTPVQSISADQGVGVGPIEIPEYLKRPQIVTREGENLLNINEFHRWGDSLETQIKDVLIENLSSLLNTPNVGAYPWKSSFTPKYQLYIDFRRFDGKTSESVILDAVWWISGTNDDKQLLAKRSTLIESTEGEGYKPYVAAMNKALKKLSQEIAVGILEILPK
jgi:uncharacterized protein